MCRLTQRPGSFLVAILALAALPAAAQPAPQPALQEQAAATALQPAASDCAPDPLAALPAPVLAATMKPEGPACKLDGDAIPSPQPAQTKSCITGVTCTKHCACTCSTIKDCNVPADCSNHACFFGISCC
jgi:hypothetical protein